MTDPHRCRLNRFALVIGLLSIVSPVVGQNIDTFAGTGTAGYSGDGGNAKLAQLNLPVGVGFKEGDPGVLYIADTVNHRVRKVDVPLFTPPRIVSWQEVEPQ